MKVIVLTPIKNESWILKEFLTVTSFFADHIIIADQCSNDNSIEICKSFPKVTVVENTDEEYSEASRQVLLIDTARRLFGNSGNIFLCLDADEIFAADALLKRQDWELMKASAPGTAFYFEKPDILPGLTKCARWYKNYFAIGYVDDGKKHTAKAIHSQRIPDHAEEQRVYLHEIKILHLAHIRKNVQGAKLRLYSLLENINATKKFYTRRFAYRSFYDEQTTFPDSHIEKTPVAWLQNWLEQDIRLDVLPEPRYSWHDYEVLKLFSTYGYKKFHRDDVWKFDWETFRQQALAEGRQAPELPVKGPSLITDALLRALDIGYNFYVTLINFVRKKW